jgi:hypothetical protein
MVIRVDSVIGSTLDGLTCKRKSATVVYMETSEMRINWNPSAGVRVIKYRIGDVYPQYLPYRGLAGPGVAQWDR